MNSFKNYKDKTIGERFYIISSVILVCVFLTAPLVLPTNMIDFPDMFLLFGVLLTSLFLTGLLLDSFVFIPRNKRIKKTIQLLDSDQCVKVLIDKETGMILDAYTGNFLNCEKAFLPVIQEYKDTGNLDERYHVLLAHNCDTNVFVNLKGQHADRLKRLDSTNLEGYWSPQAPVA